MALREYLCSYCGHQFEEIVYSKDPEAYVTSDCRCGSKAELLPSLIGGYNGNMGGSSTRPKNSTAMPKKKAFTGHPGNAGEPAPTTEPKEQLEFDWGSDG